MTSLEKGNNSFRFPFLIFAVSYFVKLVLAHGCVPGAGTGDYGYTRVLAHLETLYVLMVYRLNFIG